MVAPHSPPELLSLDDCCNERNPALDEYSLSEQTKKIVRENPDEFSVMIRYWNQHVTDPEAYQLNLKDIRAEGRRLLSLFLERTQIVAGTPVSLEMMYNHEDWAPTFIVVDEAGCLTEAMTTLTFSHFPQTPTIFIGDTKQFGPMAIAEEDREYRVLFPKQRKRSLLQRMEAAGQIDFVLRVNYRAH